MREAVLKNVVVALPKFSQNTTNVALVFSGQPNFPEIRIQVFGGFILVSSQGIPGVKLGLRPLVPTTRCVQYSDLVVFYCSLGQKHLIGNRFS